MSAIQNASLTVSAIRRKRSSLVRSACSARVRSLMSRAIADAPAIRPSLSRIGDSVRETGISEPSLRRRSDWYCFRCSPAVRRRSRFGSSSARSSGTRIETDRPIASAAV